MQEMTAFWLGFWVVFLGGLLLFYATGIIGEYMLQGMIAKKVIDVVLKKIMEKHNLNKLQKYVEEDNELDDAIKKLKLDVHELTVRLENLENK